MIEMLHTVTKDSLLQNHPQLSHTA